MPLESDAGLHLHTRLLAAEKFDISNFPVRIPRGSGAMRGRIGTRSTPDLPRLIHRRPADAPLNNDCMSTAVHYPTIPRKQAFALLALLQRSRTDGLGAMGCVSGWRWRGGGVVV